MAISDSQYQEWLERDYERRVILVEAVSHNGVTTTTRYFSSYDYISFPTDTPANQPYEGILREIPRISNNLNEVFGGNSKPAFGDIVIDNTEGERDDWLELSWIGYPISLYLGDVTWNRNDFRLVMQGVISDIQARTSDTIVFKIRDKQDLLNKQIQSTLYTTGPNEGQPIPLCYGEVYQATPVLLDAFTHEYQIHDGEIEDIIEVYQDGVPKAFTPNLADGTFTLTTAAEGLITVDAKGAKVDSVYLSTAGDIAAALAVRAGITEDEIDSDSLTAFTTLCPQVVGVYIKDRTNLLPIMDFVVGSVGGFYGFNRSGLLTFGRFSEPSGTAVLELTADDVEVYGVDVKTIIQPTKTVRLGYKRYYTELNGELSGFVTETQRADFLQEYRVVTSSNTVPEWPLALEPDVYYTGLAYQADAQDEADRRADINSVPRKIIKVRGFSTSQTLELGDEIKITYPRFGLSAGEYGIVTAINESLTNFKMEIEIWL
jgi:hypothetical protein